MKLLLDTHVWLWRMLEPERVSAPAEEAIADPGNELLLSPISTWETLVPGAARGGSSLARRRASGCSTRCAAPPRRRPR